jgi:SAM-dependent methyltransferase
MGDAQRRWAEALAAWAIPEEIRRQATDDPWRLSPNLFRAPDPAEAPADTPARRRALEALPDSGTVLDVGAGGGAASLPLAPPAARLVAVDESEEMLAAFTARAEERGIDHETFLGRWPDVAGSVPVADVVVSNHVLYNVPDLGPFALALTEKARRRVVVEISGRHPVAGTNPLWHHFWGIDRPERPIADDALDVLVEVGLRPQSERDQRSNWHRHNVDDDQWVAFLTRRLCLPPERQDEVREAAAAFPQPTTRDVVTIWWEAQG